MEYGDGSEIPASGSPQDGVVLKIYGDDSDVMQRLSVVEARGLAIAAKLKAAAPSKQMLHIGVTVDHAALRKLNEHIEMKRSHTKDVQRWLNANPLTPRFSTREIDKGISDINQRLRKRVEVQAKLSAQVEVKGISDRGTVRIDGLDDLPKKIAKEINDSQKPSLLGRAASIATLPFRVAGTVAQGFLQGAGIAAAQKAAEGISGKLQNNLIQFGASAEKYLIRKSSEIGEGLAAALNVKDGVQGVTRNLNELAVAIDKFTSPGTFGEGLEELEYKAAQAINSSIEAGKAISDSVSQAGKGLQQIIAGDVTAFTEKMTMSPGDRAKTFTKFAKQKFEIQKSKGRTSATTSKQFILENQERLQEQFLNKPNEAFSLIGNTARALAQPVKIKNMVVQQRLEQKIERLAERYEKQLPELEKQIDSVVIATGGFQVKRGAGAFQIEDILKQFFPNSLVLSRPNVYSDRAPSNNKSQLIDFLRSVGQNVNPELAFTFQNIEKVFGTALQGYNPDSVRLAAMARAAERKYKVPVSTSSFSGGVYTVEQATQINRQAGFNTKGVALGAGLYNLTGRNNPNFKTVIFNEDPLSFPYTSGIFKPPSNVSIPSIGGVSSPDVHSPKRYFANPVSQSLLAELPGFAPLKGSQEAQEELIFFANRLRDINKLISRVGEYLSTESPTQKESTDFQGSVNELNDFLRKNKSFDVTSESSLPVRNEIRQLVDNGVVQYEAFAKKYNQVKQISDAGTALQLSQIKGEPSYVGYLNSEQKSLYTSLVGKLISEQPNINRTISAIQGKKVEGYSFFDKGSLGEKRADDLRGYISYIRKTFESDLPDQMRQPFTDYVQYLDELQKAIAGFAKNKTPISSDLLDPGKIAKAQQIISGVNLETPNELSRQNAVTIANKNARLQVAPYTPVYDRAYFNQASKSSDSLMLLANTAKQTSGALTQLTRFTQTLFPVVQQGGLAIARQGLSDINKFAFRPAVQTIGTGIKTLDQITNLLPFGPEIKGITKNVAIPAATISLLSHTPVAGQMLEAVGHLGATALNFAPDMLAANMPGWAYGTLDKLLEFSGAGGAAGAAAATGAGLSKYGAYQYLARQGKSLIDVTYERITDPKTQIASSKPKALPPGQAQLPPSTQLALPGFGDPTKLTKLTQQVREAYKPLQANNLVKQDTETLVRNVEKYLYVLKLARAEAAKIPNEMVGKTDKAALSSSRGQVQKGAIAELAKRIGQDTEAGLDQGIDLTEIRKLGSEVGLALTDEVKKVLGIASPSRVFDWIGQQVVAGYVAGISKGKAAIENVSQSMFSPQPKTIFKPIPPPQNPIRTVAIRDLNAGLRRNLSEITDKPLEKFSASIEGSGKRAGKQARINLEEIGNIAANTTKLATEAFEAVGGTEAVRQVVGETKDFLQELDPLIGKTGETIKNAADGIQRRFPILQKTGNLAREIGGSLLLGFGVFTIGDALVQLGRQGFQAAIDLERVKIALDFTNAGKGAAVLDDIRQQSDALGVSFLAAAESRKQLDNATFGTALQGSSGRLAELQLQALAPRGLSADEQKRFGATTAQIAAKGRVQTEELLQFAEAGLPVQQSLSDALGISQQLLAKQLQSGSVSSQRALPLLFSQLASESAARQEELGQTAPARLNRLANESQRSLLSAGQIATSVAMPAIEGLTFGLKGLNDNLDKLGFVATTAGLAFAGSFLKSIGDLNNVMPFLSSSISTLKNTASPILRQLGATLKTLVVPTAGAAGLAALTLGIGAYYNRVIKGSDELINANRRILESVERINAEYGKTPKAVTPSEPTTGDPLLDARDTAGKFAEDLAFEISSLPTRLFSGFSKETSESLAATKQQLGAGQRNILGREAFESDTKRQDELLQSSQSAIQNIRNRTKTGQFQSDVSRRRQFQYEIDALTTQLEIAQRNNDLEEIKRLQQSIDQKTAESLNDSISGKTQAELRVTREQLTKGLNAAENDINTKNLGGSDLAVRQSQVDSFKRQIELIDRDLESIAKRLSAIPDNLKIAVEVQQIDIDRLESQVQKAADISDAKLARAELKTRTTPGIDLGAVDFTAQRRRLTSSLERNKIQLAELSKLANQSRAIVASLNSTKRSSLDQAIAELEPGATLETASTAALTRVTEAFNLDEDQKAAVEAQKQFSELGRAYTRLAGESAKTGIELDKLLRDRQVQVIEQQKLLNDIPNLRAERLLAAYKTESDIAQQIGQARDLANTALVSALQSRQGLQRSRTESNLGAIDLQSQLFGSLSQGFSPATAAAGRFNEIGFEQQKLFERSEGLEQDKRSLQDIQAAQLQTYELKRQSTEESQRQTAIDLASQRVAALRAANEAQAALSKGRATGLSKAELTNLEEQLKTASDAVRLIDQRIAGLGAINQLQLQGLNYDRQSIANQQEQDRLQQQREQRELSMQAKILQQRKATARFDAAIAGAQAQAQLQQLSGSINEQRLQLELGRAERTGRSDAPGLRNQLLERQQQNERNQLEGELRQSSLQAQKNLQAANAQQLSAQEALSEGLKNKLSGDRIRLLQENLNLANQTLAIAQSEVRNQNKANAGKREELRLRQQIAQEAQQRTSFDLTPIGESFNAASAVGAAVSQNVSTDAFGTRRLSVDRGLIERLSSVAATNRSPAVAQEISNLGLDSGVIQQLASLDQFRRSAILDRAQIQSSYDGTNIVQAIDKLRNEIRGLAQRPTTLNVSSPNAIFDAANIYRDLARS